MRRRSGARVVGVTGSTGKTSTKDILRALLRRRLRTVASHANFNTEIGLPLTLCRVDADTEAVVCELACAAWARWPYLAEIARPDVAVITSVGPVHLELVGTIEAVAEAKAEILQPLGPGRTAVVPHGEPLLAPYLELCRARVITFGEADGADVRLAGFAPAAGRRSRSAVEPSGAGELRPAPQRPEPRGRRRGLRRPGPRPRRRRCSPARARSSSRAGAASASTSPAAAS